MCVDKYIMLYSSFWANNYTKYLQILRFWLISGSSRKIETYNSPSIWYTKEKLCRRFPQLHAVANLPATSAEHFVNSLLGQVMHPSLWLPFSWPFVDACRWLYVADADIKSLSCFHVSESQSYSGAWICQWSWMNSEWLFRMFELSCVSYSAVSINMLAILLYSQIGMS